MGKSDTEVACKDAEDIFLKDKSYIIIPFIFKKSMSTSLYVYLYVLGWPKSYPILCVWLYVYVYVCIEM